MPEPTYADFVHMLAARDPALAQQVQDFTSIRHVVDWMDRSGLALAAFDLVAQDEFCHDGLVSLPDGRWLSFGMT